MAMNFPSSPTANQEFTSSTGTVYVYDGVAWSAKISAGTGNTAARLDVFYENRTNVATNYTVTTSYNAGTFGPVTINDGVTVTILDGSTWVVV